MPGDEAGKKQLRTLSEGRNCLRTLVGRRKLYCMNMLRRFMSPKQGKGRTFPPQESLLRQFSRCSLGWLSAVTSGLEQRFLRSSCRQLQSGGRTMAALNAISSEF